VDLTPVRSLILSQKLQRGVKMGNFFADVIEKNPNFEGLDRVADLNLLEPITRQKVQSILEEALARGLKLMVFETYRSQARQEALFEQGATQLQQVGVHHYGLACDIVKSIGGQPSWKGDFSLLGELARAHGLIWGGDWGSPGRPHQFVDLVHVQRCSIAKQAALFKGRWYPADDYDPYKG
jgi:hypothetical protein